MSQVTAIRDDLEAEQLTFKGIQGPVPWKIKITFSGSVPFHGSPLDVERFLGRKVTGRFEGLWKQLGGVGLKLDRNKVNGETYHRQAETTYTVELTDAVIDLAMLGDE